MDIYRGTEQAVLGTLHDVYNPVDLRLNVMAAGMFGVIAYSIVGKLRRMSR